ncbi:hypothetical protein Tco_1554290 [Tanacetum coccineum]
MQGEVVCGRWDSISLKTVQFLWQQVAVAGKATLQGRAGSWVLSFASSSTSNPSSSPHPPHRRRCPYIGWDLSLRLILSDDLIYLLAMDLEHNLAKSGTCSGLSGAGHESREVVPEERASKYGPMAC